jgi:hypothetical protein
VDDARETKESINSDHREMCRFSGKNDQGYVKLRGAIDGYVVRRLQEEEARAQRLREEEARAQRLREEEART